MKQMRTINGKEPVFFSRPFINVTIGKKKKIKKQYLIEHACAFSKCINISRCPHNKEKCEWIVRSTGYKREYDYDCEYE